MGERVEMVFDSEGARGRVELRRGCHGAELVVNGVTVGFIDLYPCLDGKPAQLVVDGGPYEDPLAKIIISPTEGALVVHKDAILERDPAHGIHHSGDYVFYPLARDDDDAQ